MKLFKIACLTLLFIFSLTSVKAQSEKKIYNLKKGQVFDIIFLSNKADIDQKRNDYFTNAIPYAKKGGYASLGGIAIKETPTLGNYHPEVMVFGTWEGVNSRKEFLKVIDKEWPKFHQMRREIWSTFDLTYYEVKVDLSFEIDPVNYNAVTSFWSKDKKSFQRFKQEWLKKVNQTGGNVIIELTDGASPFGYYYNPDYMVISSWSSKTEFDKFNEAYKDLDLTSVQQVNQLKLN